MFVVNNRLKLVIEKAVYRRIFKGGQRVRWLGKGLLWVRHREVF